MRKLIASEFQRICMSRKTIILLILVFVDVIYGCLWEMFFYGSYDHVNYNVHLNSLNFSPFAFGEASFILFNIVLPIIIVESINYEKTIGAFRNYMIRPYKKYQFLLSKWLVLVLVAFIIIVAAFVFCIFFGHLFMPKVSTVKFYNINQEFNALQVFLYLLKFIGMQFFVAMFIISVSTIIAVIIPNSVISILTSIALIIVGGHLELFKFIGYNCKYAFYTLGNAEALGEHFILLAGIVGFLLAAIVLWTKKDYLN